jgi:acetoin utilization deacetylase AcuC-like enzyme
MSKTALLLDERFTEHDAVANHPERPERIVALLDLMKSYHRDGLVEVAPRLATRGELLSNHTRDLVEAVEASSGKALQVFDADTAAGPYTFDTARLAAGGFLSVLDAVVEGHADNGFALVRPPGHHAESDRAMGFCFFNNVAIGARYLQEKHGLQSILVVDWDVHHGNGTQRSFFAVGDVLFVSLHQYPYYPGTGAADEIGVDDGLGRTINVPFPAGSGNAEYAAAFERIIEPVAEQFEPDFVLISAGFDCHRLDPLGGMRVTAHGFSGMTSSLQSIADRYAGGRCAAVLEGGYSVEALTEGVSTVLDTLGGSVDTTPSSQGSQATRLLDEIVRIQKRFWKLS